MIVFAVMSHIMSHHVTYGYDRFSMGLVWFYRYIIELSPVWGNSDHVVNGTNPSAGVVWSPT